MQEQILTATSLHIQVYWNVALYFGAAVRDFLNGCTACERGENFNKQKSLTYPKIWILNRTIAERNNLSVTQVSHTRHVFT